MTEGEKMIWAAAYALELEMERRKGGFVNDVLVTIVACHAVCTARKAHQRVLEDKGKDDEVTLMLEGMLQ